MSVLIKGIELPESCSDCAVRYEMFCPLRHRFIADEGRRKDCPLIPVPPHGRLIDADVLMENEENISFKDEWHMTVTEAFVSVKNIAHAPTIIEAEEGE